jgi:dihydroneopterin aldolase
MHPVFIAELVEEIASTGVDYIKIGLASDNSSHPVIRALKPLALKRQLIAVFFADQGIDNLPFDDLQHNGFTGVMLDTFDKSKGSLRRNVNPLYISDFISQAQSKNLLCGLAGSLKLEDISQLAALKPDYLGFRGALCPDQNRTAAIDKALVHAVKNAIVHSAPLCSAATP